MRIRSKVKLFEGRYPKRKCRLTIKIGYGEVAKRYYIHSNDDIITGQRQLCHGSANDQHAARQLQIHVVLRHVN